MTEKMPEWRVLTPADVPGLEAILRDDGTRYLPRQLETFLRTEGNWAFGAFLEGQIIGLIYGYTLCPFHEERPQFFVYSVAIHSAFQNRGYGTRFYQFVVDDCRRRGYAEVFVATDRGNPRACRVYEKAGGKSDYANEVIYVTKLDT